MGNRSVTYQDVDLSFCALNRRLDQQLQVSLQRAQLLPQPKTHVRRNLLIPAASRMQLSANILADNLAQASLIRSVNVLIVVLNHEAVRRPLFLDLCQALLDRSELVLGQDVVVEVCASEGDGAGDIFGIEEAVVGKRGVVLLHYGIEALYESVRKQSIERRD